MWHTKNIDQCIEELSTSPEGLASTRAKELQEQYGTNELTQHGGRTALQILWEQFTATMVLILIGAGVVALFLQDWLEAIAIFSIVVLFGIMGFLQEFRAEKALAALKKLAVPQVRVRRDGVVIETTSVDLVPGDVVLLEAGNLVPADCRLIANWGVKIQESALTGESEAVEKQVDALSDNDAGIGDRRNMAFMGTLVGFGRAEGLVVATGMKTELGKIADLIQTVEEGKSPLQTRLEKLGQVLAIVGVALSVLVAVLGVAFGGQTLPQMLIVGVSMAVAIIPEGLPAVLTITLALGARRMFQRHALIRKLPAVETLGSVTVICSDKTGTLTQNRMTVVSMDSLNTELSLAGEIDGDPGKAAVSLALVRMIGVLCNDSRLGAPGEDGKPRIVGDPTEACLLVSASRGGFDQALAAELFPRVGEHPFDSSRKRMSTWHSLGNYSSSTSLPGNFSEATKVAFNGQSHLLAVKGSVDGLLTVCTHIFDDSVVRILEDADRIQLEKKVEVLASKGMRVLGFAWKSAASAGGKDLSEESGLIFAGMVGIIDPPRPEVKAAIAVCHHAGIRPVMITGDHPLTAKAIAKDLGMGTGDKVVTGKELEHMEDSELRAVVHDCSVFARVSPEHKLRIVDALQSQHQVVAMTGDGVNDAPALRKADIGVAMGITGTDVSKEASQMVLTDDNFASIVSAVEEGRVIYDNIRKYIKFSIGGNAGKVLVLLLLPLVTGIMAAIGFGQTVGATIVPVMVGLSAIQLLWLNLLGDGLLSLGLGVEHAESDVMDRSPVKPKSSIFDGDMNAYVFTNGLVMGAVALLVGVWWWLGSAGKSEALTIKEVQTVIFMVLFFLQMWSVLEVRTGKQSMFKSGMKPNMLVWLMVIVTFALQLAGMYVPLLRDFLGLVELSWQEIAVLLALGAIMIPILEVQKYFQRKMVRK